jgi:hypothetical protein
MQVPPASTAGTNPYSAKGALNKKVFDPNIVPTLAAAPAPFLTANPETPQQQSALQLSSSIFVPPPPTTIHSTGSSASLQQLAATNTSSLPPPPTTNAINFNHQQQASNLFSGPPQPQLMSNNSVPHSASAFSIMPPLNSNGLNGQQFVDPSM